MRSALPIVMVCGLILAPANAQQTGSAMVPAIVERAASFYAASVRGVIGMERHFMTTINGGVVHHSEQSESGFLMRDGAFVKIKYYRITDDGKALGTSDVQKRDTQTNRDWAAGKIFFKEPYDPRFIGDYKFEPAVPCTSCPTAGTVQVAFSSSIKDTQHGNGTVWIEESNGRVQKLTYVPNALPPHATSGTVTELSGQALANLWYVLRIDETYQGKAFLFKGSADFSGTFDHFQRFASVAEGEAQLASLAPAK